MRRSDRLGNVGRVSIEAVRCCAQRSTHAIGTTVVSSQPGGSRLCVLAGRVNQPMTVTPTRTCMSKKGELKTCLQGVKCDSRKPTWSFTSFTLEEENCLVFQHCGASKIRVGEW